MRERLRRAEVHVIECDPNALLLMKVNTLGVFEIEKMIRDILELGPELDEDEVVFRLHHRYRDTDIQNAITQLREWLVLFTPGEAKKQMAGKTRITGRPHTQKGDLIWLCLSNDCNLRCTYCAADKGCFGGPRKLMDAKTAAAARQSAS